MKKIYEAENYIEAHMIVHALEEDDIRAFVKDDREPLSKPTVWIEDECDYSKAVKTIDKINEVNRGVQKTTKPVERRSNRFGLGFLVGSVCSFLIFILIFRPASIFKENETQWDLNRDGVIDAWRERNEGHIFICHK